MFLLIDFSAIATPAETCSTSEYSLIPVRIKRSLKLGPVLS
jgi:hypothetical protein